MFYTVYKTTNLINGKFYIGTHKTKDPNDSYLGSGTLLLRAIEKYGRGSFRKEVLFVFDTPADMFAKEAELVTEEFLAENNTYNLKKGGEGGFDFINSRSDKGAKLRARKAADAKILQTHGMPAHELPQVEAARSKEMKRRWADGWRPPTAPFKGLCHSDSSKRKIAIKNKLSQSGSKNSQYGTMWINNGVSCKKISKELPIPEGWFPGRKLN